MCPFLLSFYRSHLDVNLGAGDIYFQLVLKNITFCFVQYVIDRFLFVSYVSELEWRITDSNR